MMRDSFIMYTAFYEPVKDLSDSQLGQLFRAIFADRMGAESGSHLADASVRMAFSFIANQFKIDDAKYNEVISSRREAGKAGAIKRWQKVAGFNKDSKSHKPIATDSKDALNENENENENENVVSKKAARFAPPTIEQVREYIAAKGYKVDAVGFHSYYSANGWKVGRNPMKNWKAAVVNWAQKEKAAPVRRLTYDEQHPIGNFKDEFSTI